MFKAVSIFIGTVGVMLMFGCSSGGKSSDSKTPPPAPLPASVEYAGSIDIGRLNQANAGHVLFGFFRLMSEAYFGATLTNPYVSLPDILLYESFESDGECETGDIQISEGLTPAGNNTVSIKIRDCKTKTLLNEIYEVGDGELTYISAIPPAINYQADLPYLSIKSALDTLEFTVAANSSTDRVAIEKAVMKSMTLKKVFMLENFVFENSSSGKGRLYVSTEGYFDVLFDGESKALNITGADGTELRLSYKMGFLESGMDILYDLTAQLIIPSEPFSPFISRIDGSNLLDYQVYFINDIPHAEPAELQIDRLRSVILDASFIKDQNYDFLKFDWLLATERDGCQTELVQTENHRAQFSSDCAGEFVVNVAADDGRDGVGTSEIYIQVLPFPADFAPLEQIEIELGQELDVQLTPTNIARDGPFEYSPVYLPSGISLSADGKLSGHPASMILGGEQHFKLGINVDNGRNTFIEMEVSAINEQKPFSLFSGDVRCLGPEGDWWDYDLDGKVEVLCEYFGSYLISEISEGIQRVEYLEKNPPRLKMPLALNYTQFDDSAEYELVVAYSDEIVIIDSLTKNIKRSITSPIDLRHDVSIFPSIDDVPGFFLQGVGNNAEQFFFYNSTHDSFSEIGINSSLKIFHQARGLLQIDGGEIVFAQLQDMLLSENSYLADIDGDGAIDLVTIEYSGSFHGNPKINAVSLLTDAVINYPALAVDFSIGAVLFVNIDDDSAMEFVATDLEHDQLTIFDWVEDEVQVHVIELPTPCQMYMAQLVPTGLQDVPLLIKSVGSTNLDICKVDKSLTVELLGPEIAYPISDHYPIGEGHFDLAGNVKASFSDRDHYPSQLHRLTLAPDGELLSATAHELGLNFRLPPILKRDPVTEAPVTLIIFGNQSGVYEYDFETFELVNRWQASSHMSIEKIALVDMDKDGLDELILFDQSSALLPMMTVLDMRSGQSRMFAQPHGQFLAAVDMNGDDVKEFIFFSQGNVTFYNHQADALVVTATQNLAATFPAAIDLIFGVQDVNGDADFELIVTGKSFSRCDAREAFPLLTLDAELKPLFISSHSSCIQSIPNITSSGGKQNLIAYGGISPAQRPLQVGPVFNAFIEIDAKSGKAIWQSRPFLGRLNPTSLNLSTIDGVTKSVTTEAGLYIFE